MSAQIAAKPQLMPTSIATKQAELPSSPAGQDGGQKLNRDQLRQIISSDDFMSKADTAYSGKGAADKANGHIAKKDLQAMASNGGGRPEYRQAAQMLLDDPALMRQIAGGNADNGITTDQLKAFGKGPQPLTFNKPEAGKTEGPQKAGAESMSIKDLLKAIAKILGNEQAGKGQESQQAAAPKPQDMSVMDLFKMIMEKLGIGEKSKGSEGAQQTSKPAQSEGGQGLNIKELFTALADKLFGGNMTK